MVDFNTSTMANLAAVNALSQAALSPQALYGSGGFGGTVGQYPAYPSFGEPMFNGYYQPQPSVFDTGSGIDYGALYGGGGGINPFSPSTYTPNFNPTNPYLGGYNPFDPSIYAPTPTIPSGGGKDSGGVNYTPQTFPPPASFDERFGFQQQQPQLPSGFGTGDFAPSGAPFDLRFSAAPSVPNYQAFGGMFGSPTDTSGLYGFGGAPSGGKGGVTGLGGPNQSAFGDVGQSPGMGLNYGGFDNFGPGQQQRQFDPRVFNPGIYGPGGQTGGFAPNQDMFNQSIYGPGGASGGWGNSFTVPDLQQMPQGGSGK